jgi:hypothetical protein
VTDPARAKALRPQVAEARLEVEDAAEFVKALRTELARAEQDEKRERQSAAMVRASLLEAKRDVLREKMRAGAYAFAETVKGFTQVAADLHDALREAGHPVSRFDAVAPVLVALVESEAVHPREFQGPVLSFVHDANRDREKEQADRARTEALNQAAARVTPQEKQQKEEAEKRTARIRPLISEPRFMIEGEQVSEW